MKVTNESSDLSMDNAHPERQVLLYSAISENSIPEKMEEIKISIVNERATGSKRQQEDISVVTPRSKRHCSVFSCSTPRSAPPHSRSVKRSNVSTSSHALEQNPEFSDEWDDSLLQPSDNEDDSPLFLTVDEIESLLEDDSCFAAEPSNLDKSNSTCIVAPDLEDEKEKVCTSPCSQLDDSNTLTEATLCEEDINNYATLAPSPTQLLIHSVEVQMSKQKSSIIDNVKSFDSVQETNGMSTVPILDKMEALTHQHASDCSANLPLQSPNSLYTVDVVEWSDDPELCFDGDIDDLLAISPGDGTSSEEEVAAEPYKQCTELTKRYEILGPTSTFMHSNPVSVTQTADSAGSDTADVVQQLSPSPSSVNLSDALKVYCPSTVPEPPKDSGSPSMSTVVISESQSNNDAAEDVKPSTSTESDALSALGLSEPFVNSSSTHATSSQQTTTTSETNSSTAAQNRTPVIAPLPRPAQRSFLSALQQKDDKDNYCRQVLMHIGGPEGTNIMEDPFHELGSLLNQISKENPNWQHPSNLSKRNHPRYGKKPSKCYTLNQWVKKNGGPVQRFMDIPSPFERNPLPEVLPF